MILNRLQLMLENGILEFMFKQYAVIDFFLRIVEMMNNNVVVLA